MKRTISRMVLMALVCLWLAPALAQRPTTTRIFDVGSGGRIPGAPGEPNSTSTSGGAVFYFQVRERVFRPGEKIVDVNINLDIVHSWVEDLEIWLISPARTRVLLFRNLPGGPPRFDNFDNTYFTDEAPSSIVDGRAPYNDKYRPQGNLARFRGEDPTGTWRLEIDDHYYGDYGYLYRHGNPPFEDGWRGPLVQMEREGEWTSDRGRRPFWGGTWLEITVPEPTSLLALLPALAWLARRRR